MKNKLINIAFAIYLAGLSIIFPLITAMQMKHGSSASPKVEKTSTPAYDGILQEDEISSSAIKPLLLKLDF